MRFSLIVSTRGRTDELEALFVSLERQSFKAFEVILVDQNGDDRLVPVVARFGQSMPIRHIRTTSTGLSRGRNTGLRHASGELIGFPDDDCEIPDDFLEKVDALFTERRDMGGITTQTADRREPTLVDARGGEQVLNQRTVLDRCAEFTMYLRRGTIKDVQFDEALGVGSGTMWGSDEGPDFLIRLMKLGARITFVPTLVVYHPRKHLDANAAMRRRAWSYGLGRGHLLRTHGFPLSALARNLLRPLAGAGLYALRFQPRRSAFYFLTFAGRAVGFVCAGPRGPFRSSYNVAQRSTP